MEALNIERDAKMLNMCRSNGRKEGEREEMRKKASGNTKQEKKESINISGGRGERNWRVKADNEEGEDADEEEEEDVEEYRIKGKGEQVVQVHVD